MPHPPAIAELDGRKSPRTSTPIVDISPPEAQETQLGGRLAPLDRI